MFKIPLLLILLACVLACSRQYADPEEIAVTRDAAWEQRQLGMENIVLSNLPAPSRVFLRFPFYAGSNLLIGQGTESDFTHFDSLSQAIDFLVEEGTPILAIRSGQVERVVSHNTEGGLEEYHKALGNLVEVRHEDGTIAMYLHLKPHGSRVVQGQMVHEGDHIGDSGNTGYSSTPHLHLHIWANAARTNSIPIFFRTAKGPIRLVESLEYTAPEYDPDGRALPEKPLTPVPGLYASAWTRLAELVNGTANLSNASVAFTRWISNAMPNLKTNLQEITREARAGNRDAQKTLAVIMARKDLSRYPDLARILDPKNPQHPIVSAGLLAWWSISGTGKE